MKLTNLLLIVTVVVIPLLGWLLVRRLDHKPYGGRNKAADARVERLRAQHHQLVHTGYKAARTPRELHRLFRRLDRLAWRAVRAENKQQQGEIAKRYRRNRRTVVVACWAIAVGGLAFSAWWNSFRVQPYEDFLPPEAGASSTVSGASGEPRGYPSQEFDFTDSSALDRVEYDPASGTLVVVFTTQSTEYHYCDVPVSVYQGLITANSAGSYFNDNIADQYDGC